MPEHFEFPDLQLPVRSIPPLAVLLGTRGFLQDVTPVVLRLGYAVARFDPEQAPTPDMEHLFERYRHAVRDPRVDATGLLVVCEGESARRFAESYYEFFGIQPPEAVIFVVTPDEPIRVKALNDLTCPYLLIHAGDSTEVKDAVLHHQMRYGDGTTHYRISSAARALTHDPRVLEQIEYWLKRLEDEQPLREPA